MVALPDSLRILAVLRELDSAGFANLIRQRRVTVRGVGDLLDLAEQLDEAARIHEAVDRLPWPLLRGLRRGDAPALVSAGALLLAVADPEGTPELLPAAAERTAELLPEVPVFTDSTGTTPATAGIESARSAGVLVTDALYLLDVAPRTVRHARDGARMSGVDVRRLAVELDRSPSLTGSVYRWLAAVDAIAPDGDVWHPTARGRALAEQPVADRWRQLVNAWVQELHLDDLRAITEATGAPVPGGVEGGADDGEPETATSAITLPGDLAARLTDADALGLIDQQLISPLGALVLDDRLGQAQALLAEQLPDEVDRVYLQPDQTIIAPGPLPAALDARLRRVARLERRALASEYRITAPSVARALASGLSADAVRSFLAEISLTGVPQPVDYLITNSAERFGLVRVRSIGHGASRIRSDATELLDAMRVDAGLSMLALRRSGTRELDSRVSPDTALATLLDAHYPAVAEDATGAVLPANPPVTADPASADIPATALKLAAALAAEAAASTTGDDELTWLRRRLELARREKRTVVITVDVPGGEPAQLNVVPISVSEQRVRARDIVAEVERTVPMGSIIDLAESAAPSA